ncbi:DUF3108 domain-containing protein [Geminicoccus roseus]|uniref:DUF3108 domain-containing protein n=1 Tax=Geminicoccus roseus TaxID=404900 RepID=UPI0003F94EB1|nr:DUF3108 domain-containing protein [Geminicoccus roseus]
MIHRRGVLIGALAAATLLPRMGLAADTVAEDFRLGVNWGGLHVADLVLAFRPDDDAVAGSMTITSRGVASLLTSYSGQMSSVARELDGRLVSQRYRAYYESRRYTRDIEIHYDEAGNPADIVLLKRGEPQKVDIPKKLWANTVDPLTGILRIRRWMASADRSDRETVPIFDGRSRYDIEATALPAENGAARARLVIQPIASASNSSWLKKWQSDDGRWIEARVSNDPRAVPLLVQTQDGGTASSIELAQDCSGNAACS